MRRWLPSGALALCLGGLWTQDVQAEPVGKVIERLSTIRLDVNAYTYRRYFRAQQAEKQPPNDAATSTLTSYWERRPASASKPDSKTVQTLLDRCTAEPRYLSDVVSLLTRRRPNRRPCPRYLPIADQRSH